MLDISFTHKLSLHARRALREARDIARYTRHGEIGPRHLLLALTLEHGSLGSVLLDSMGFEKERVGRLCLKRHTDKKTPRVASPPLSPIGRDTIKRAYYLASHHGYPYVGTEHLVSALFEIRPAELTEIIEALEIDERKVDTLIESHLHFDHFPQLAKMFDLPEFGPTGTRTKSKGATPFLDQFAVDLAKDAEERNELLVGRETELERLMQILGRKQKNNCLLIGEPGVGKTALVAGLAKSIARGEAGPVLMGKRILSLDLALLVAGTSFRGEFESRIKEVLREAKENKHLILFIDEIHTIIGAGNTNGSLDAANILKPALARGEIQCIGATTLSEYKRHFEKDAALERRFQTLLVSEPTAEETTVILERVRPSYEAHHGLSITQGAIETAVELSLRYLPDRFFPDKALDLLDEAASFVRRNAKEPSSLSAIHALEEEHRRLAHSKEKLIEDERYDEAAELHGALRSLEQEMTRLTSAKKDLSALRQSTVTSDHLFQVVTQITGIPHKRLSSIEPGSRLARIERSCAGLVVGQDEALSTVLTTLARSVSGVNDPHRPLGSFLFLGPTGVGKTHLAKVLAKEYFGDEKALIRLDMSEFMERHSAAQILGAPAGYVGFGEGGKLTEQVRRRPYSVVLFDEIEKAHPDISNLLLQMLDEGILTDAEGRRVSFKNTLIILTSNFGTENFTRTAKIGFGSKVSEERLFEQFESIKKDVLTELKRTLRPELIARLDSAIVFRPLDESSLKKVAQIGLDALKKRLKKNGYTITIRSGLLPFLVKKSFAPEEGARLVRKNIEDLVEQPLARAMLAHPKKRSFTVSLAHGKVVCR